MLARSCRLPTCSYRFTTPSCRLSTLSCRLSTCSYRFTTPSCRLSTRSCTRSCALHSHCTNSRSPKMLCILLVYYCMHSSAAYSYHEQPYSSCRERTSTQANSKNAVSKRYLVYKQHSLLLHTSFSQSDIDCTGPSQCDLSKQIEGAVIEPSNSRLAAERG